MAEIRQNPKTVPGRPARRRPKRIYDQLPLALLPTRSLYRCFPGRCCRLCPGTRASCRSGRSGADLRCVSLRRFESHVSCEHFRSNERRDRSGICVSIPALCRCSPAFFQRSSRHSLQPEGGTFGIVESLRRCVSNTCDSNTHRSSQADEVHPLRMERPVDYGSRQGAYRSPRPLLAPEFHRNDRIRWL